MLLVESNRNVLDQASYSCSLHTMSPPYRTYNLTIIVVPLLLARSFYIPEDGDIEWWWLPTRDEKLNEDKENN